MMRTKIPNTTQTQSSLILLFGFSLLLGVIQIIQTYSVFSHVWDEPAHIASGMQLLGTGDYSYELQHPPLARVATALFPWLSGIEARGDPDMWNEGWRILYDSGPYQRTLSLARAGILPFFVLLVLIVWHWGRWQGGTLAALLAVVFTTTQPALLAHAGLATTDLPMVALCMASLFAFVAWLDQPTLWRCSLLGVCTGLAFMSKFSAIPFLAVGFLVAVTCLWWVDPAAWNPRVLLTATSLRQILLSVVLLFLSAWAVFGFSWSEYPPSGVAVVGPVGSPVSLPAFIPATQGGIKHVLEHNQSGHRAFLLGEVSGGGWWYFFPLSVLVKATIPMLLCAFVGLISSLRSARSTGDWKSAIPGLMALAILAYSTTAGINIGVRHVLLVFPLLALQAAVGVQRLLRRSDRVWLGRFVAGILLLWQSSTSLLAHPDYLAWFNALAGDNPERVLLSGDLDWGQDLNRLGIELQRREIPYLGIAYNGFARLDRHGLPPNFELESGKPVTGWVAASLWEREADSGLHWLKALKPVTRVGKSIDLYYIRTVGLPEDVAAQAKMREGLFLRYKLGQLEASEKRFSEVLEMNPRHYGALNQRARVLQDMSQPAAAIVAWQAFLEEAQRSNNLAGLDEARSRIAELREDSLPP